MLQRLQTHPLLLLIASALLAAPAHAQSAEGRALMGGVKSGRDVIERMHDAYAKRWPRTVTFDQTNTAYDSLGHEEHSTWHEYAMTPARLRIDQEPLEKKNGALYRGDSLYVFRAGQLRRALARKEPLHILIADVFATDPALSVQMLRDLGFNMDIVRQTEWNGRHAVVVGAAQGDSTVNQFWVDLGTGLVVRMITRDPGGAISEMQVLGRAQPPLEPVETELLFLENGKPVWREKYQNIRQNVALSETLFDPGQFNATFTH